MEFITDEWLDGLIDSLDQGPNAPPQPILIPPPNNPNLFENPQYQQYRNPPLSPPVIFDREGEGDGDAEVDMLPELMPEEINPAINALADQFSELGTDGLTRFEDTLFDHCIENNSGALVETMKETLRSPMKKDQLMAFIRICQQCQDGDVEVLERYAPKLQHHINFQSFIAFDQKGPKGENCLMLAILLEDHALVTTFYPFCAPEDALKAPCRFPPQNIQHPKGTSSIHLAFSKAVITNKAFDIRLEILHHVKNVLQINALTAEGFSPLDFGPDEPFQFGENPGVLMKRSNNFEEADIKAQVSVEIAEMSDGQPDALVRDLFACVGEMHVGVNGEIGFRNEYFQHKFYGLLSELKTEYRYTIFSLNQLMDPNERSPDRRKNLGQVMNQRGLTLQ